MTNEYVSKLIEKNGNAFDGMDFESRKQEARERGHCMWSLGDNDCNCTDKDVYPVRMFNNQITIICCHKHFDAHIKIMMLHRYGHTVDDVIAEGVDAVFEKTFGTTEVNRESCIKLFEKHNTGIASATDEELIEKLNEVV